MADKFVLNVLSFLISFFDENLKSFSIVNEYSVNFNGIRPLYLAAYCGYRPEPYLARAVSAPAAGAVFGYTRHFLFEAKTSN